MTASAKQCKVIIIGAGIVGAATALCLARLPYFEVLVLESKPGLEEIGAGIQVPPNASRIICSLGLRREFEEVIAHAEYLRVYRYNTGKLISSRPRGYND